MADALGPSGRVESGHRSNVGRYDGKATGDWTFFGVAKPTLGARASRQASRPQLWPQAIGAASGRSEAG
ncbi:MAG: hypothetical protein L0387_13995, partial [Acidobacteria bacterium]|nr:hypothetical protein [Acidobacteriota bacterium]